MKNSLGIAALVVLALSAPIQSLAQCSTGAANDEENIGVRSFGRQFAENINVEIGNSFVLDCAAQFLGLAASFSFSEGTINEHPPLAAGDTLRCSILDQDKQVIMARELTIPLPDLEQTLYFDFSAFEFKLTDGLYYFMIGTHQDRYGYIVLGAAYDDGAAQITMDGTWYEQTLDIMFNMDWDPDSGFVPSAARAWSAVKADYR